MSSRKPYKLDRVAIRMVKEPPLYSSEPLRSPEAAVKVIADMLRQYDREAFCIVNLRNDLSPINMNIVSTGTLNASLAHPREILKSAVLSNASATMLFHNHPSGNLMPSREDTEITDRMSKLFALAEMPLLALYSGERGRLRLKYLFYIYYPLHLIVLEGIRLLRR